MVKLLLGQQSSFTKHPCFLCIRNSRAKSEYWIRKKRPLTKKMMAHKNIIHQLVIATEKIILTPLFVKFVLVKQFVMALNRDKI